MNRGYKCDRVVVVGQRRAKSSDIYTFGWAGVLRKSNGGRRGNVCITTVRTAEEWNRARTQNTSTVS
jgi:hypothetical protein